MEIANVMLNLAEEGSTIIKKYGVTPAEVAVLRLIHGSDSINDVEILAGDAKTDGHKRTHREELARLLEVYGHATPEGGREALEVTALFPGAAARVFETFEELELDDSLYIASGRKTAKPVADEPEVEVVSIDQMTIGQLKQLADEENIDLSDVTRKADIIARIEEARAAGRADEPDDDDDGIGEMSDRDSDILK